MAKKEKRRELTLRLTDRELADLTRASFARGFLGQGSQQAALLEAVTMWMEHVAEEYGKVKIEPPQRKRSARRASGE